MYLRWFFYNMYFFLSMYKFSTFTHNRQLHSCISLLIQLMHRGGQLMISRIYLYETPVFAIIDLRNNLGKLNFLPNNAIVQKWYNVRVIFRYFFFPSINPDKQFSAKWKRSNINCFYTGRKKSKKSQSQTMYRHTHFA